VFLESAKTDEDQSKVNPSAKNEEVKPLNMDNSVNFKAFLAGLQELEVEKFKAEILAMNQKSWVLRDCKDSLLVYTDKPVTFSTTKFLMG